MGGRTPVLARVPSLSWSQGVGVTALVCAAADGSELRAAGPVAVPPLYSPVFSGGGGPGGVLGRESAHPPACPQISLRRGMQADPGALAALCEKTDNDIRACINTLQVGRRVGGAGG